jgi:hypothetical protein
LSSVRSELHNQPSIGTRAIYCFTTRWGYKSLFIIRAILALLVPKKEIVVFLPFDEEDNMGITNGVEA